MVNGWNELTRLTNGERIAVERVRLLDSDIAIEGRFELPPAAYLSAEDQVFVSAFIRCHGSIKQMEQWFGVSYPTIKNRLNRIGDLLGFGEAIRQERSEVLSSLERGEISVAEALEMLRK